MSRTGLRIKSVRCEYEGGCPEPTPGEPCLPEGRKDAGGNVETVALLPHNVWNTHWRKVTQCVGSVRVVCVEPGVIRNAHTGQRQGVKSAHSMSSPPHSTIWLG